MAPPECPVNTDLARAYFTKEKLSSVSLSGGSTSSPIIVSGATSAHVTRAGVMVSVPVPDND
jgi:hypothetical protein